eukprot:10427265-Karenia_brevis.AAC.1
MKLHPVQMHMLQSRDNYQLGDCGEEASLVAWALDALLCAPRNPIAVRQHGGIAHSSGGVSFLKQIGTLTDEPPLPVIQPVYVTSRKKYFVAFDATRCLEEFSKACRQSWPSGTPATLSSGKEAVEFARKCIQIRRQTLHDAGPYVSKQLTRKLVWVRASALNAVMYSDVEVFDLKDMEPDRKKGFGKVPDNMKASTLSRALGDLNPLLFSLVFCQWEKLVEQKLIDAEWVTSHLPRLMSLIDDFKRAHGFPPHPHTLVHMVLHGNDDVRGDVDLGPEESEGEEPSPKRSKMDDASTQVEMTIYQQLCAVWDLEIKKVQWLSDEDYMAVHEIHQEIKAIRAAISK